MAHHHPNPSFNGLNDDQVSRIFARITCTASLVAELSREHAATAGNTAHKTTFQALDALVSTLGPWPICQPMLGTVATLQHGRWGRRFTAGKARNSRSTAPRLPGSRE